MFLIIILSVMTFSSLIFLAYPLAEQKKLKLALMLVTLVLATSFYALTTHFSYFKHLQSLRNEEKLRALVKEYNGTSGIIKKMAKHLTQQPSDPKGWYLLGRLYWSERNIEKAYMAFSKAYHLSPEDRKYAFQYILAKDLLNKDNDEHEIQEIGNQLIEKDSNDVELINFMAVYNYKHHHLEKARVLWLQLLPKVNAEDKQWLLAAIEKTKQ